MNSGIYKIVNKINGHYYVGKSRNLRDRWSAHKRQLLNNKHHCAYLQNAYNKDGVNNFEFVVVEYLEPNDILLTEVEQKYIDKFLEDRKNGINNCYNIAITSDSSVHSEETKKKISESLKGENHPMYGKTHSTKSRKKISENTKRYFENQENRKKLSESMVGEKNPMYGRSGKTHHFYGKTHSKETKKKMSQSLKGENNPRADKTTYTWKNIITNETFTGTRYNFRKTHNISENSMWALIHKIYSRTRNGWTLQEKHSDQSFPQPL